MKTNKSYTKRLKVTKSGKIIARGQGRNHFRAKQSRRAQLANNRSVAITTISNKAKSRFLPNA